MKVFLIVRVVITSIVSAFASFYFHWWQHSIFFFKSLIIKPLPKLEALQVDCSHNSSRPPVDSPKHSIHSFSLMVQLTHGFDFNI